MQPIVVQKYGGSSVADCERILAVARRVAETRARGKMVVVVVSAMGRTTDDLYAQARKISSSPSRRELDMLLSCGERAAMALLSMAVQEHGYDAISFTGSQCGILTNDRHWGARIIEVRPVRVQDELERGKVVIVAGFQGVSYRREITTLGRGGSDTTAVALAAALGAEYCEICSDVEGVFSADPRIVGAAELLEAISHDEMLELSSHGAKVLHPEAVEFARRERIALYARPTSGDSAGTRIDETSRLFEEDEGGPARGVAGQRALVRISCDDLERVVSLTKETNLCFWQVWSHEGLANVLVSPDDVPDWAAVRSALEAGGLNIEDDWGAVSVVGFGVGDSPRELATVLDVSGDRCRAVVSSSLRITVFCACADVDALVANLHAALFEEC